MPGAKTRKVLFVASECYPLIKTGGLADVVGALPLVLGDAGCDARILLPGFPSVLKAARKCKAFASIPDLFGGEATLMEARSTTGLKLFILEAPHLFDLDGNPYQGPGGKDRADNHVRFAALSKVAAALSTGTYGDWRADIVHSHDWQTALTALYLKAYGEDRPRTVFTVHNLAFQGLFPKSQLGLLDLPQDSFSEDGLEYWDKISFLKAGVVYSDHVTTVSPSYAAEIQSEDGGMGLGGLLRSRNNKLSGILNGIDTDVWNPATDTAITAPYDRGKLGGKAKSKLALQKHFGLREDRDALLFCVISRLTEQKGLDLLPDIIPHIVGNGCQLVVLGSGDKDIEKAFLEAASDTPEQVGTFIGYNEDLAHLVQAGADAIIIPSRFEPCGLTQLCAMRYGTLPIVSRVGGLADTVVDANEAALQAGAGTGIVLSPASYDSLRAATDRAMTLFSNRKLWKKIQRNAMKLDVSWTNPAARYIDIYDNLIS